MKNYSYIFIVLVLVLGSCSSSDSEPQLEVLGCTDVNAVNYNPDATQSDNSCAYTTPYTLAVPPLFETLILPPLIPATNPLSVEGVALGRELFYDPILSGDNTQACAACHSPEFGFTDNVAFSIGIDGDIGTRNSMPLVNLAWNFDEKFFWDGRSVTLEQQILEPVVNPIEMHNTWENAVSSLQATTNYPGLFQSAFGTSTIDRSLVAKAIAQFLRTLISGNSRFDRHLMGENILTEAEIRGFDVYINEDKGDCFHCHGLAKSPLWTDNIFHNNGLDAVVTDKGLGDVTGDPSDFGKFKTPTLRNLAYSAPYMHDGRFETLEEVIDHYSEGLVDSPTVDPLLKQIALGGVQLTADQKSDLKAFLLSLSDPGFISNPAFQDPN